MEANAPLGDRSNMVFSGCSITYGTATAIVTATGMDTEMGKIANLLDSEESVQTPLQRKLAQLGKYLGILALAACAIIFVVGLSNGIPAMEIFMTAVSLAVSAIPEGLPAIVTIVLSIGVQRMVKKNAIIRSLPAVETLGSASVICSDKTGTLTQNRMTLVEACCNGQTRTEAIHTHNSPEVLQLLKYAALCCDGSVVFHGTEEQHIGDPTETAIVLAAHKNGMPKEELNRQYPRLAELPFDSDRKLMTTIHQIEGKKIAIVKGAFDVMASRCVSGDLDAARAINEEMSNKALRVIAVAYRELTSIPVQPTPEELEKDLTFLGLVGMIDPPRPEAKEAVSVCRKAGIKPVMITGDHVVTASAIARELGILKQGDLAITGTQLDAMTDSQLDAQVENISVYARVSPENKIRIVKAWQRKDQVVSMTGDGVNDAPALKAADIGCAMGITGTDVAKGAADMTLTDDNFATIVDAVREGRGIYANIRKVVGFLLGTNIGEVFTVFMAMILWHKSPLLSMQLLWINLVTDCFPALALGMEKAEPNIMRRKPRDAKAGIFANGMGVDVAYQGALVTVLVMTSYFIGHFMETGTWAITDSAHGTTMAFLTMSMAEIFHSLNMRSQRQSIFKLGSRNKVLLLAAFGSLLATTLVCEVPFLANAFEFTGVELSEYVIAILLGAMVIPIVELVKFVQRKLEKEA